MKYSFSFFRIFSDITNLKFRKNYVLSCEALGFLSKYGLRCFYLVSSFKACPIQHGYAPFRRKNDNDYRCHCDLSMAAKSDTKIYILITSAFNFRQTVNAT